MKKISDKNYVKYIEILNVLLKYLSVESSVQPSSWEHPAVELRLVWLTQDNTEVVEYGLTSDRVDLLTISAGL